MKFITTSICLLFLSQLNAQEDIKLVFSLSDDFSYGTEIGGASNSFNTADNMFISYRFSSGIETAKVCATLNYSYGGLINYDNRKFNAYNFHLLGLGLKFYLLKNKKVIPFISIDGASEIGSTSKGVLLNHNLLLTSSNPGNYSLYELSQQSGSSFSSYADYNEWLGNVNYQKTTFIGSLKIGASFQLYRKLKLDFGIGMGGRNIKVETPRSHIIESGFHVFFDAQLGLSYSIPLKKKVE